MEGLVFEELIYDGAVLGAAVLAALGLLLFWWRASQRRAAARQRDAARFDAALLQSEAPAQLVHLSHEQQRRWQRQCARFLREKRFIGCAGLVVSDAQRHSIAGMACLLRVQAGADDEPLFPTVHEVLLYPGAFLVPPVREALADDGLELVDDEPDERIGEQGPGQVVLSWQDVEAATAGDAVHVVIHEFAHALDSENPDTEGAPPLADYREWSQVMAAEFARLQRHRRPPVLDPYGATAPAEFWCVVAEAFFQRPEALARHHAALFALVAAYLQWNPLGTAAAPLGPAPADNLAAPDSSA